MPRRSVTFSEHVLDSLSASIAVLDADGCIVAVNEAWRAFARNNGAIDVNHFEGENYVRACEISATPDEDDTAGRMARGIRALLTGTETEFHLEYPCHSPDEHRWFIARASPLIWKDRLFVVVSHENITARKLAEINVIKAKRALEETNQLLAKALERETLLARTDALTELHNRRYFMELARLEFASAERYAQSLAIAIIDIDRFKRVNDRFGHLQGDHVLKRMGAILRQEIRQSDLSARFGGEEFIVLLRNTDVSEAVHQLERLRMEIESTRMEAGEHTISVTISIGVAQKQTSDTLDALIGRADAALYRAKAGGRNRVLVADAQLSVNPAPVPSTEPEF